jgi:hypothetical protein
MGRIVKSMPQLTTTLLRPDGGGVAALHAAVAGACEELAAAVEGGREGEVLALLEAFTPTPPREAGPTAPAAPTTLAGSTNGDLSQGTASCSAAAPLGQNGPNGVGQGAHTGVPQPAPPVKVVVPQQVQPAAPQVAPPPAAVQVAPAAAQAPCQPPAYQASLLERLPSELQAALAKPQGHSAVATFQVRLY